MGIFRSFSMDRIWKLYARVVWGDWGEVGSYGTQEISHPVVWVRSSNWRAGQYMFGGIFLNEECLEELSNEVSNYVFLHEYGHGQPPFVLRLLSILLQLVLLPMVLVRTVALPVIWFMVALQVGLTLSLIPFTLSFVIALTILLVPLMIVRWLDEGYAEVFAATKLGVTTYEEAKREMRKYSNPSLPKLGAYYVLYPPIWLVSRIASKRCSKQRTGRPSNQR